MSLVSAVVLGVVEEAIRGAKVHQENTPAEIEQYTKFAVKHGASKAARLSFSIFQKEIPKATFQKYLDVYNKNIAAGAPEANAYFVPQSRGRQQVLSDHEHKSLIQAIAMLRKSKKSISATAVSCMARGIVKRLRPGLIESGAHQLDSSWANKWMKRNGFHVHAKQTDRNCTDAEVRAGAEEFYGGLFDIADAFGKKIFPWSVFNYDEFFVSLGG